LVTKSSITLIQAGYVVKLCNQLSLADWGKILNCPHQLIQILCTLLATLKWGALLKWSSFCLLGCFHMLFATQALPSSSSNLF